MGRRTVVLATGGFDPIHSGHIEYLRAAKDYGDLLVVGLNSDEWLTRKKGKPFMSFSERFAVLQELRFVDFVFAFDDSDGSARDAIVKVRNRYDANRVTIIFANGGDRTATNIPEMDTDVEHVAFAFGVGGNYKMNSSSDILKAWDSK